MVVNFSNIDMKERPTLILKNAGGTPLGTLGFAKNVRLDLKYNEISTLEFELPAFADGMETPFYDDVTGMRVIEVKNIGQFILTRPTEVGDGVTREKKCLANSLEYEFVYKKISVPKGTYKFHMGASGQDTVTGMILELMPSWGIGSVSTTLYNKYRTFEERNENVYNFIKGTVQESFNCIFDFDTMNRRINIRDVNENPQHKPVYISTDNLAKEIEVEENTEDMVTRLDVNGAEGVNIRDVNPTGTNKLIMLDYFMNTTNFDQALIDKYYAWQTLCDNNRQSYYNLSMQYNLYVMKKTAAEANLADLQGDMTGLENAQAVAIQSIAAGLQTQSALDQANANIRSKNTEIASKNSEISSVETDMARVRAQLEAITQACSFENYFTQAELVQLDRYMIDNEIAESSFVAASVDSYTDNSAGGTMTTVAFSITGATMNKVTDAANNDVYDVHGGNVAVGSDITGSIVSATVEKRSNGDFIATAYLGSGSMLGNNFPTACITLNGTCSGFSANASGGSMSCTVTGYMYFTLDASVYQQHSISWDLYEYGMEALRRLAYPTYTFSVDSANFLALDDFDSFKNHIELGQKVYISPKQDQVLEPICIGVKFDFGDLKTLELQFSDSYVSGDSTFRLIDLLDKSVSMGRSVDLSRYIYSSFVDSGASTSVRDFMNSALDTAKNAILSSTEQAISWDGAGLRLRRYSNEAHTAYENEQIWMNNNSIVMTDDAWNTAKMAIGKFHDDNLGDCWGIVAPMIVGTILAGERLVIESAKKDGGIAVFRVDEDGCQLFNTDFNVQKTNSNNTTTQISLNPDIGIAIGNYPLYTVNQQTGHKTLIPANAKFWADDQGNLNLIGRLTATSLYINADNTIKPIDEYIIEVAPTRTYAQTSAPTGLGLSDAGAIWYDTDDNNKPYRWDGAAWVAVQDGHLDSAVAAKPNVFVSTTAPTTGYKRGDIWQNPSENYRQYTATGNTGSASDWVLTSVGHLAGTSLVVDPMTGLVTILAQKKMTIASGGTLELAGNNAVSIGSGGTVSLVGATMQLQTGAAMTVNTGGTLQINSGGSFIITSPNFNIDSNGNVSITGAITSTSGTIGGWTIGQYQLSSGTTNATYVALNSDPSGTYSIWAGHQTAASAPFSVKRNGDVYAVSGTIGGWTLGANNLHSGSTTTYVALDSNSSSTYAIWAGAETAANAPFSVQRDGTVTMKKMIVLDESGSPVAWNPTSASDNYPLWKTRYASVKSATFESVDGVSYCSSLTFTNAVSGHTTVNFKHASAVDLVTYNRKSISGYPYYDADDNKIVDRFDLIAAKADRDGEIEEAIFTEHNVDIPISASVVKIAKGTWDRGGITFSKTASGNSESIELQLTISDRMGNAGARYKQVLDGQTSTGLTFDLRNVSSIQSITLEQNEISSAQRTATVTYDDQDTGTATVDIDTSAVYTAGQNSIGITGAWSGGGTSDSATYTASTSGKDTESTVSTNITLSAGGWGTNSSSDNFNKATITCSAGGSAVATYTVSAQGRYEAGQNSVGLTANGTNHTISTTTSSNATQSYTITCSAAQAVVSNRFRCSYEVKAGSTTVLIGSKDTDTLTLSESDWSNGSKTITLKNGDSSTGITKTITAPSVTQRKATSISKLTLYATDGSSGDFSGIVKSPVVYYDNGSNQELTRMLTIDASRVYTAGVNSVAQRTATSVSGSVSGNPYSSGSDWYASGTSTVYYDNDNNKKTTGVTTSVKVTDAVNYGWGVGWGAGLEAKAPTSLSTTTTSTATRNGTTITITNIKASAYGGTSYDVTGLTLTASTGFSNVYNARGGLNEISGGKARLYYDVGGVPVPVVNGEYYWYYSGQSQTLRTLLEV